MALTGGFVHSAVPAAGQAAGIHTAFTNNLSGDWTVHAQVTFQAATNNERVYWVMEHSSGGQILFYVANGIDADGNNGIDDGNRMAGYSEFTDLTLYAAYDPNGGAAGSNSFYDNLYNNALDPAAAGFWNQTLKTRAARLGLWLEGWTTCYLWVSEGGPAMDLIMHTSSDQVGNTQRMTAWIASSQLIDDTSRAPADRPDTRAGLILMEDDTANPPNVENYKANYHYDGAMQLVSAGPGGWFLLGLNEDGNEPDGDGNYLLQTMVAERQGGAEGNGAILGVIRKDLAGFHGPPETIGKVFGNALGAAFIHVGRHWATGFWGPLGDVTP